MLLIQNKKKSHSKSSRQKAPTLPKGISLMIEDCKKSGITEFVVTPSVCTAVTEGGWPKKGSGS